VARRCRGALQTVGKWRRRFLEQRVDGPLDKPRLGHREIREKSDIHGR